MKTRIALLSCCFACAAIASAQQSVSVRVQPASDAPVIGQVESLEAAPRMSWPEGRPAVPGWQPVQLHGPFDVYLLNNDMAKDMSPKPGSVYYLSPNRDGPRLGVATEQDQSEILSIASSSFVKIRVQTAATGYVQTQRPPPGSAQTYSPQQSSAQAPRPARAEGQTAPHVAPPDRSLQPPPATPATVKVLQGTLAANRMFARNRTGTQYRLVSLDGETLAFVDTDQLTDRVRPRDLVNQEVRVNGMLEQNESGDLIIVAQNIARVN